MEGRTREDTPAGVVVRASAAGPSSCNSTARPRAAAVDQSSGGCGKPNSRSATARVPGESAGSEYR
ncbi:hypothetical protein GCM10022220_10010 [Actinocatenispora rupis]